MLKKAPGMPGVDPETSRKTLEARMQLRRHGWTYDVMLADSHQSVLSNKSAQAVSKNPEMLKSAMDSFKSMPEEVGAAFSRFQR